MPAGRMVSHEQMQPYTIDIEPAAQFPTAASLVYPRNHMPLLLLVHVAPARVLLPVLLSQQHVLQHQLNGAWCGP